MSEGRIEDLLSQETLSELINNSGDITKASPEAQFEFNNAKMAMLDAQIKPLADSIQDDASVARAVGEFGLEAVGGGLGASAGARAGMATGSPTIATGIAGVLGQEGADLGGAVFDAASEFGSRVLPKEGFQGEGKGILESIIPSLGAGVESYKTRRQDNVLNPQIPSLTSALEVGLNALGARKDISNIAANQLAKSQAVESLKDFIPSFGKDVSKVAAKANQEAGDVVSAATTAFGGGAKAYGQMSRGLRDKAFKVADRVGEFISGDFKSAKNFNELGTLVDDGFSTIGQARADLAAEASKAGVKISTSGVDDIMNVGADPALVENLNFVFDSLKGLSSKNPNVETIVKELNPIFKTYKLLDQFGNPIKATGEELDPRAALEIVQKLKSIRFKGEDAGLQSILPRIEEVAYSLETAVQESLRKLDTVLGDSIERGISRVDDFTKLTDDMTALKSIQDLIPSAGGRAATRTSGANIAAIEKSSKEGLIDKISNLWGSIRGKKLPALGEDQAALNAQRAGDQGAQLDWFRKVIGASESPIQTAPMEVPGLFKSGIASMPYSGIGVGINELASMPEEPAQAAQLSPIDQAMRIGQAQPQEQMQPMLPEEQPPSVSALTAPAQFDPELMGLGVNGDPMSSLGVDPLVEGIDKEEWYAGKINIPDANAETEVEQSSLPKLERNTSSVMQWLSTVDPAQTGVPQESLDAVKALLSGSLEDQREGVNKLIEASPNLFMSSKIPGIESLVDGVVVNPDEQAKLEAKVGRTLESDPARKFELINKIRRQEQLPNWGYKYLGGEEQKSFEDAFLEKEEGLRNEVYLDTRGNPTIGIGVNLGAQSIDGLRESGVSEQIISKVAPFIGVTGDTAKSRLKSFPVKLDSNEAMELSKAMKQASKAQLEEQYKNETGASLEDLPVQARTVLLSLAYNFGNVPKKLENIWNSAVMGRWDLMAEQLRSSKWKQPELVGRRQREADLLDEIAPETIQLASNVGYDDDASKGETTLSDGEKMQTYKF